MHQEQRQDREHVEGDDINLVLALDVNLEKISRRLVVDIVYSISQWLMDSAFLPSSLGKIQRSLTLHKFNQFPLGEFRLNLWTPL